MIRQPPRSTRVRSSAASDVYKRQDLRPGHGVEWEPFPGQTSFTKNSELMNAETAAWGRAILACGLPAKRGLASRQEVQNRVAEQEASKPAGQKETRSKATT